MIIMGIDLGTKRTGISLSDDSEVLAYPFCTIKQENRKKLQAEVIDIVEKEKVSKVILGIPINMNGTLGSSAKSSKDFGTLLQEKINLKKENKILVKFWDERLSTKYTQRIMTNLHISIKKSKNIIDCATATTILQNFLDYQKINFF